MSKLDGDRATVIYDALEGLQGTIHHLAPETRKAVAGHLARTLPAASAVVAVAAPPTGQTAEADDTDLSEADIDRMMAAGVPVQIVTAPPATYAVLPPPADRAALERVRAVLESEAVVGRSALEYRGLITSALMADEAQPANLHAQSGIDTPGCDCGHDGMGLRWHGEACAWVAGLLAEARELLATEEAASAGAQTDEETSRG